ncbi:4872_t:CDS:2 [Cetraspora pellucida]|uniref:4872_t:CDS:1 n=1 Tax=Cetraspora pellucida TaxID=1433469 RepID=A0A9N9FHY8_9GLOM|nr:4872_t:CDS:2 [Cetraspora pellucida]
MHCFEDGSLRQYLDNNHIQLSFGDKRLYHIHSQGIIHRDFRPDNILIINTTHLVPSGNEELDEELLSDNPEINEFIEENDGLIWIPYEQLSNIEYLAHGGFGVVSKARWKSSEVALKCLNNSKNLTADVLQEIAHYQLFDHSRYITYVNQCYGISQDPTTGNYLIVMHYFENGSLRQYLDNNHSQLPFGDKLGLLYTMANGLYRIHSQGLIHRDFHPGNILNRYSEELLSGLPPYYNVPHDISLTIDICNGLHPNLDIINVPQLLKESIIGCWDYSPLVRPTAFELLNLFRKWYRDQDEEFYRQYKLIEDTEKSTTLATYKQTEDIERSITIYQLHPQAIYTSRLLYLYLKENVSENLNELHVEEN